MMLEVTTYLWTIELPTSLAKRTPCSPSGH
jgi:hypothetical protein